MREKELEREDGVLGRLVAALGICFLGAWIERRIRIVVYVTKNFAVFKAFLRG